MLETFCHIGFFRDLLTCLGVSGTIMLFLSSRSLRKCIGNLPPGFLIKMLVAQPGRIWPRSKLFESSDPNFEFDYATRITLPFKEWSPEDWSGLFVDQVLREQHFPRVIKRILQNKLYCSLTPRQLTSWIKHWLGLTLYRDRNRNNQLVLYHRVYTQGISAISAKVHNLLKLKQRKPVSGFTHVTNLFVMKSSTNQKMSFTKMSIELPDGTKCEVPELLFVLKPEMSWNGKHTKREIVISNKEHIGVITARGKFIAHLADAVVLRFLKVLEAHHVWLCSNIGKISKRCVFCTHELVDPDSLAHGYGQMCAKTHNLRYCPKDQYRSDVALQHLRWEKASSKRNRELGEFFQNRPCPRIV
jgi:hypothetical protein